MWKFELEIVAIFWENKSWKHSYIWYILKIVSRNIVDVTLVFYHVRNSQEYYDSPSRISDSRFRCVGIQLDYNIASKLKTGLF